ncbi:hypothetical protein [Caviibacter abscessus]|uniref:hypothetical protein n=1 Tax=Caviibacter abscessus TaxID=1766719 RepID=UPI00083985BD|nr:hypothetical protein [Caviibacter abscessus]
MKKNRKIILSLAALSASTMTYAKVEDKIKEEVTFGIDTHFGADAAERVSKMTFTAIDLNLQRRDKITKKRKNQKNKV